MTLRARTVRALGWRGLTVAGQALLQLVVLAVLARFVSPAEYGLVAVAGIAVAFGTLLSDAGIAPALVQREQVTREHVAGGFAASLLLGVLLCTLLWALAPALARFFDAPDAAAILRALSISFVFNGAGNVAAALLERRLAFGRLVLVDLGSYAIGYAPTAVSLAVLGYGAWALVVGMLVQAALRTAASYALVRHPVRPLWAPDGLAQLLRFGAGSTSMRLFNVIANRADYVVAGKLMGMASLGIYERAFRIMDVSVSYIGGAVAKVMFPAMARVQSDRDRLTTAYLVTLGGLHLLFLPLSVMFIAVAPEIVAVLLGPRWSGAVLPLRMLFALLPLRTATRLAEDLARSRGAVYRSTARKAVFAAAVAVFALLGGMARGLPGLAGGVLAAHVMDYVLMGGLALSLLDAGWRTHWRFVGNAVWLGLASAAVALPVAAVLRDHTAGPWPVLVGTTAAVVSSVGTLLAMVPGAGGPATTWVKDRVSGMPRYGDAHRARQRTPA